jgi:hypothetical protein
VPSRREIDYEFELGRLLDWQVHRLGALQNFVRISRAAPKQVGLAGTVGHTAASVHIFTQLIHRRQPVLRHKVDDPPNMELV